MSWISDPVPVCFGLLPTASNVTFLYNNHASFFQYSEHTSQVIFISIFSESEVIESSFLLFFSASDHYKST